MLNIKLQGIDLYSSTIPPLCALLAHFFPQRGNETLELRTPGGLNKNRGWGLHFKRLNYFCNSCEKWPLVVAPASPFCKCQTGLGLKGLNYRPKSRSQRVPWWLVTTSKTCPFKTNRNGSSLSGCNTVSVNLFRILDI